MENATCVKNNVRTFAAKPYSLFLGGSWLTFSQKRLLTRLTNDRSYDTLSSLKTDKSNTIYPNEHVFAFENLTGIAAPIEKLNATMRTTLPSASKTA